MTDAARRARNLARIGAVQAEMVKLAEYRLAAARRRCDQLVEERRLLSQFVGHDDPLGTALATAALRTGKALEADLAQAGAEVARLESEWTRLRRRDRSVAELAGAAAIAARREAETVALGETMEAWLARASLP